MKAHRLAIAASFALAAASSACGGGRGTAAVSSVDPPVARAPQPLIATPLVVPGETLRFDLSLRGIVGGEAVIAVGQPGMIEGRPVILARSRTETVGLVAAIKKVQDEVITHIDAATGVPVYQQANVVFGDREALIETRFGGSRVDIEYERKGLDRRQARILVAHRDTIYEAHSVVGLLRGWAPKSGDRAYFYIVSGRRLWRNDVVAIDRAEIETSLGRFRALRIDGVATRLLGNLHPDPAKQPRHFSLWISDDTERRPLRVVGKTEYGDVKAELVEHEF